MSPEGERAPDARIPGQSERAHPHWLHPFCWGSWPRQGLVRGQRPAVGARLSHGVVNLFHVVNGRFFGRDQTGPEPYHSESDKSQGHYARRD